MKNKIITITLIISLITIALPATGVNQQKIPIKPTGILFYQGPRDPSDNDKNSYTSDTGTYNFIVYENYWNLTHNITKLYWYGYCMKWEGFGWKTHDLTGLKIDISFYYDYNNTPGDIFHTYIDTNYTYSGTGIYYEWFGGDLHEMTLFEYTLDPQINLTTGWISIHSTDHPNGASFLWMNSAEGDKTAYQQQPQMTKLVDDLAFKLTDDISSGPDLQGTGSLTWPQIPAGSLQTGTITIENIGDPFSKLFWEITQWPNWGTWTFTPETGQNLTPESGPQTIQVRVIAPQQQSQQFTGEIKIINTNDPTDYAIIPVSLSTPTPTFFADNTRNNFHQQIIKSFKI